MRPGADARGAAIVDAVIHLLETEGYDAVQVRRVAADASVSLSTLYKLHGSRDELIVHALERWMLDNAYAGVEALEPTGSTYDTLVAVLRTVFARWEHQPHMLVAYIRARMGPGGARLDEEGFRIVGRKVSDALAGLDPAFADDLAVIIVHVLLAALGRFAAGEIAVDEIVPLLERTLRRLLDGAPQPLPDVRR